MSDKDYENLKEKAREFLLRTYAYFMSDEEKSCVAGLRFDLKQVGTNNYYVVLPPRIA